MTPERNNRSQKTAAKVVAEREPIDREIEQDKRGRDPEVLLSMLSGDAPADLNQIAVETVIEYLGADVLKEEPVKELLKFIGQTDFDNERRILAAFDHVDSRRHKVHHLRRYFLKLQR